MRKVKPETKSAVSEDQARAKAETDIESTFKRTRSSAKAKRKANSYPPSTIYNPPRNSSFPFWN